MLESELGSLDKDPKTIQWPPQPELTAAGDDIPNVDKKVRQKWVVVVFFLSLFLCIVYSSEAKLGNETEEGTLS